jgi:hypothetical protein
MNFFPGTFSQDFLPHLFFSFLSYCSSFVLLNLYGDLGLILILSSEILSLFLSTALIHNLGQVFVNFLDTQTM